MKRRVNTIIAAALAAVGMSSALSGTAAAGPYPDKPIRVIIPFTPRGGTDITARQFGIWLEKELGQTLVIDNRPGAGGTVGAEIASRQEPDGYTLLIASASMATAPAMYKRLDFDPVEDFDGIYLLARQPHLLCVTPSLPPSSLKELMEYARSRPGELNYASAGNGSSIHLSTELLRQAMGIKALHVPYRGSGPAILDVMGGRAHMIFGTMPSLVPQARAEKLKAIAVSSDKRAPALPDVPTIKESGLPSFTYYAWYGMFAPDGTPQAVVAKLNGTLRRISAIPENRAKLENQGLEAWQGSAQQFESFLESEIDRWKKVVSENDIPKLD